MKTMAKITSDDIKMIKARYFSGEMSRGSICEQYGISQQVVNDIVNDRIWKYC